jgi:hypothetical protein
MIYSTTLKNRQTDCLVNLDSKNIKEINSCKYLGLFFDSNLKWKSQINWLLTKLKILCKFAYYLSKVLDTSTKLTWNYAFVYSLLTGHSMTLLTASNNLICKIQSRQIKIIRILFHREIFKENLKPSGINTTIHDNKISSKDVIISFMNHHKILNYSQIGHYNLIMFILKQRLLFVTENKNRFNIGFKLNENNKNNDFNLRSDSRIRLPFYSKGVGQLKFDYRSAIIINNIPFDTLVTFFYQPKINKRIIKEYILKI